MNDSFTGKQLGTTVFLRLFVPVIISHSWLEFLIFFCCGNLLRKDVGVRWARKITSQDWFSFFWWGLKIFCCCNKKACEGERCEVGAVSTAKIGGENRHAHFLLTRALAWNFQWKVMLTSNSSASAVLQKIEVVGQFSRARRKKNEWKAFSLE